MRYIPVIIFYLISVTSHAQVLENKLLRCKPAVALDSVYCGSYPVFENHQTKLGRKININIIVIPAIDQTNKSTPIFYFDGGPGTAATKNVDFFSDRNNPYRQTNDIVLIDVRGTGGSNPLHCQSLQYKRNLQEHFADMYPANAVKACFDSLSAFADLTQYTTTNIVKDIEEIRKWLGYKKIIAFGLSYGTRLTQEYLRRFPNSIEAAVLWSPTSTGSRMPLYHAQFAQATWDKLVADCAIDPQCNNAFPELKNDFQSLMLQLKNPVLIKSTDSTTVSFTWNALQTKIRTLMYDPYGLRQIPFIVHEAATGNWKPLLNLYPTESRLNEFIAEGLYLSITCSEDVPFIKSKETKRLTKNTFMGGYRVAQQKQACANWVKGKIPQDFLQPVRSDIPVLILAGEWDPVTPASMAIEIARHLPNSQLVVVPQMSHMSWGLSNEQCLDEMIVGFIRRSGREAVNKDCISGMAPPAYKLTESSRSN